jgi:hypothetical protein
MREPHTHERGAQGSLKFEVWGVLIAPHIVCGAQREAVRGQLINHLFERLGPEVGDLEQIF